MRFMLDNNNGVLQAITIKQHLFLFNYVGHFKIQIS